MSVIKNLIESEGLAKAALMFCDIIQNNKDFNPSNFSLKQCWEAFVGPLGSTLQAGMRRQQGFIDVKPIKEADVKTTAFSNILGVLIAKEIIKRYKMVSSVGALLTKVYKTNLQDERFPGFNAHENVQTVQENEPYPEMGFDSKYVGTGVQLKKGMIINVTEEAVFRDQTNLVLEQAAAIGNRAREQREKTILSGVTGATEIYFPLNVSTALYDAAPQLVASNALADWTDIEKALVSGFGAMTDEKSELIEVDAPGAILLVPLALKMTAKRIVNATEIVKGDFDSDTSKTFSNNPIAGEGIIVVSSARLPTYTGNATTWYYGFPKKQFRWKELWPLQVFRDNKPAEAQFTRDVVARFKVRYWGGIFATDNKYFLKCTA